MNGEECFGLALIALPPIIFLWWWVATFNSLVSASAFVNQSIGALKACYQKRMDLVPDGNSAAREAIAAQMRYFDKILEIRKSSRQPINQESLGSFPSAMAPMMAAASAGGVAVENNPAMDVSAYSTLMSSILKSTEDEVSGGRRMYWDAVARYNTIVRSFPSVIVAKIHGFAIIQTAIITAGEEEKPDYNIHSQ